MAYLKVNNRFNPYSLEEVLRAYQLDAQEQSRREDLYNTIGDEILSWTALKNSTNPSDVETYNKYVKPVENELQNYSEKLATSRLSREDYNNLKKIRKGVKESITPLQDLYTRRNKEIEEQNALRRTSKGKVWFTHDPSQAALDEYRSGPVAYSALSEDMISADAEELMRNLASSTMYDSPISDEDLKNDKIPFFKITRTLGFSPQQVDRMIANDDPRIVAIKNAVKSKYNFADYNLSDDVIDSIINSAIRKGNVYKTGTEYKANPGYLNDYQQYKAAEIKAKTEGRPVIIDGKTWNAISWNGGELLVDPKGELDSIFKPKVSTTITNRDDAENREKADKLKNQLELVEKLKDKKPFLLAEFPNEKGSGPTSVEDLRYVSDTKKRKSGFYADQGVIGSTAKGKGRHKIQNPHSYGKAIVSLNDLSSTEQDKISKYWQTLKNTQYTNLIPKNAGSSEFFDYFVAVDQGYGSDAGADWKRYAYYPIPLYLEAVAKANTPIPEQVLKRVQDTGLYDDLLEDLGIVKKDDKKSKEPKATRDTTQVFIPRTDSVRTVTNPIDSLTFADED